MPGTPAKISGRRASRVSSGNGMYGLLPKERQDKGIFEGGIPNMSRTRLLLAIESTEDGETRIHEQMLQRMDQIHAA